MAQKIEVAIASTKEIASVYVVDSLSQLIGRKPNFVLGTATGETMIPIYQEICSMVAYGMLSLGDVSAYQLDEYYPIAPSSEQSYRYFLMKHLVQPTDMKKENLHVLNGLTKEPQKTCARWDERLVGTGGIDLQLLGIGVEGHIAFIEARRQEGRELQHEKTRLIDLADSTIEANRRFLKQRELQPTKALTVGLGTLLPLVNKFCLVAFGSNKSNAVADALLNPIGDLCPASYIREGKRAMVVLDKESAVDLMFRMHNSAIPKYLSIKCL